MSELTPCKHLDFDGDYTDCEINKLGPPYGQVRYWKRGETWTTGGHPENVQFCKKRGRINGILQCYYAGEMSCYEPD